MTKKKPKLFNKEYQKQWSNKHKYRHIHTGEHCTFEAYVAELLVLRWTDAFGMDKPSYKFWTVGDKYHNVFMRNMKALQCLKKRFEEKIIIEAIRSSYFKKIYHIGIKAYGPRGWKYNKVAIEALTEYNKEKKATQENKNQKEFDIEKTDQEPKNIRRKSFSNKNKSAINKLRNL